MLGDGPHDFEIHSQSRRLLFPATLSVVSIEPLSSTQAQSVDVLDAADTAAAALEYDDNTAVDSYDCFHTIRTYRKPFLSC